MVNEALELLGHRVKDRVTNFSGVVTSVCFDLYGCVQAALQAPVDEKGEALACHWYDVSRLDKLGDERVMEPPAQFALNKGPAEKPAPR
jgi:hypothetical protein